MTTLELKRKVDKAWAPVPVEEMIGMTFGEMFGNWEGQDVVALVHHGADKPGVVAGTKRWQDYYVGRGYKVMSFRQLIDRLQEKGRVDVLATTPLPASLFTILSDVGLAGDGVLSSGWPMQTAQPENVA